MADEKELERLMDSKQAAWSKMQFARAEMKQAWTHLQVLHDRYCPEIQRLQAIHDRLHHQDQEIKQNLAAAHRRGDSAAACRLSHQEAEIRRQKQCLPVQWRKMTAEIKAAKFRHQGLRADYFEARQFFLELKERVKQLAS